MSYLGRAALQPSWKCHGGGDGCRAWEEGKDERVDCAQHLGRIWIKVALVLNVKVVLGTEIVGAGKRRTVEHLIKEHL